MHVISSKIIFLTKVDNLQQPNFYARLFIKDARTDTTKTKLFVCICLGEQSEPNRIGTGAGKALSQPSQNFIFGFTSEAFTSCDHLVLN